MPACDKRERHEDADHVERNQRVGVAAEDHQEDAGEHAEADDAVGEREPVALVHELAGQVAVARENRRQPGKSAYAVFAASTRISIVAAWTA